MTLKWSGDVKFTLRYNKSFLAYQRRAYGFKESNAVYRWREWLRAKKIVINVKILSIQTFPSYLGLLSSFSVSALCVILLEQWNLFFFIPTRAFNDILFSRFSTAGIYRFTSLEVTLLLVDTEFSVPLPARTLLEANQTSDINIQPFLTFHYWTSYFYSSTLSNTVRHSVETPIYTCNTMIFVAREQDFSVM